MWLFERVFVLVAAWDERGLVISKIKVVWWICVAIWARRSAFLPKLVSIVCELIDKTGCAPCRTALPALRAVCLKGESSAKCPTCDRSLMKSHTFQITNGALYVILLRRCYSKAAGIRAVMLFIFSTQQICFLNSSVGNQKSKRS